MTDSVGIMIPDAVVDPSSLDHLRPMYPDGCFRGQLGSLRVTQHRGGVYIRGSLPRYFKGDNILPLTREEHRECLGRLEAETGIDLRKGQVLELEVATTLPVSRPPRTYLEAWGSVPRMQKNIFGNGQTVTLANAIRSFSGYDKGREVAPGVLPDLFDGSWALRLELKWKKKVKHLFGHTVNPWDLAGADAHRRMVLGWTRQYEAIPKRRVVAMNVETMTAGEMGRAYAAIGIYVVGLDEARRAVSDGHRSGTVDVTTANRMRALILKLSQEAKTTRSEVLTEEVDRLVQEAAERELTN